MRRLLLAWLLALPLVAVGAQLAHWLGYTAAAPDAAVRAELLATTGHGYLAALPVLVTVSVGLVFAVFLLVTLDGARGRTHAGVQRWPFAVVPFLGFIVQELVERGVAGGGISLATLVEQPVLLGLLLQLPFALAAFAIAVVLTRVARQLGRSLARGSIRRRAARPAVAWPTSCNLPAAALSLATAPARGPPPHSLFSVS
ncbi:MAG: hypothetical protein ACR2OD_10875 [Gaiellaceae bacterium]